MEEKKEFVPDRYWYDSLWIYLFGFIILIFMGIIFYRSLNPEWKKYQKEFKKVVEKKLGPEVAKKIDFGIKQIWNMDIMGPNVADRCITCHMGVEIKGLEGEDVPVVFRTHPNPDGIMDKHPIEKFGCTSCHGGQGPALTTKQAHAGKGVRWLWPVYTREMQKRYKIDEDRLVMVQINCNHCHRFDKETPGMDYINLAKQIIQEKNCRQCHVIDGYGGNIGPALTYEGDKPHELFDFSHIEADLEERELPKTVFTWHILHFENPQKVVPGSVMPNYGFTDKEKVALAMLVMSWRKIKYPVEYLSNPDKYYVLKLIDEGRIKATEIELVSKTSLNNVDMKKQDNIKTASTDLTELGKQLFSSKGCNTCHNITDQKLVGPGLKGVAQRRTKDWIIAMIYKPDSMLDNDPIAKQLLKEYNNVRMVLLQPVSKEEAEAIYEYLKTLK
ncbi:MAG: c-type cytochrome [Candidatus Hydrothermia bacterium]|jgi:cytochrome c2